jgi:predicted AAA+ superfamily ATPase
VPDVRLRDDVEDSGEDSSSEGDKGDPENHKHVQSDAHNSIDRVASKTSVVDRLKVLLATSEEEGEDVDNDELLLNLQAIINGSQPLAL